MKTSFHSHWIINICIVSGLLISPLFAAPLPVTAISAHYVATGDNIGNYTDPLGNTLKFSQGNDNELLVDSITVSGNQMISDTRANSVNVIRISQNQCTLSPDCDRNVAGVSGERQSFIYPYTGSSLDHNITSSRAFSIEGLYLSNAINIAIDNPMSNVDNNIERLDIILSDGVLSPKSLGERALTGFMISERWGNNPHQIAAIKSLAGNGNPTSFFPLSKASINNYGNTRFTITHADGSVTGPALFEPASNRYRNQLTPVPGGVSGSHTNPLNGVPQFSRSITQPVRSTFHSFQQLGVPVGAQVFGFSVFGIDVTDDMDLVSLTDVPLNTDSIIRDSADLFGSISNLFVPGDQAIVGIAKRLSKKEEIEAGIFEIELEFTVENLSKTTDANNVQVSDDLETAFAGARSVTVIGEPDIASFTSPAFPFNGSERIELLSGADTLVAGSRVIIRLNLRVDVGISDGIFQNTAIVSTSVTPGGDVLGTDLSDEGVEPDSDGDGRPDGAREDDPTIIILGSEQGSITVTKSVGEKQVGVGDIVSYSLAVKNNTDVDMQDVVIQDTPPKGFSYVDDSAFITRAGVDGQLNTRDDVQQIIKPTGTSTKSFGLFSLSSKESAAINYLLRVGAGVTPGIYENLAVPFLKNEPAGPQAVMSVEVVRDALIDQDSIIGVVFHDRDEDGYQDDANASNIRLRVVGIDEFLEQEVARFEAPQSQDVGGSFQEGYKLSGIPGRVSKSQSSHQHEIQLHIPLKTGTTAKQINTGRVIIESAEGTWLEGEILGTQRSEEKRGSVAKGVNNQQLAYSSKLQETEDGRELVITLVNDAILESGIPGVRLATVEGLLIETDSYGRYHLADVNYLDRSRGSQFIIKVDKKTLPRGSEFSTENPRVMRITGSVLNRINFGVVLPEIDVPVSRIETTVPAHMAYKDTLQVNTTTVPVDGGDIPSINFDSGKSGVSDETLHQIDSLIHQLEDKENVRVQATGHTDPVRLLPDTAKIYGDNQGLSEARAEVVAQTIRSSGKLRNIDIEIQGKSYSEPIAENSTELGRAQNRRVEVQVVYDKISKRWIKLPIQIPSETKIENRALVDGGRVWVTEDPSVNDPRLDIEADGPLLLDDQGKMKEAVQLSAFSNYKHFIKRWELTVFPPNDRSLSQGLLVAEGSDIDHGTPIRLLDLDILGPLSTGDSIGYRLRVFDENGHWDETVLKQLGVVSHTHESNDESPVSSRLIGRSSLAIQSIPIHGSRIRVIGASVSDQYAFSLDGVELEADSDGNIVSEQHLPVGKHALKLEYKDKEGNTWNRDVDVEVEGNSFFMVGLANLTLGGNSGGGAIENLGEGEQFGGDNFVNARGAFYLKGKIKGKYLVTAQLDTNEDEFENWDEQLKRKDRKSLFRQLDPERYYPVYGDDSSTYSDVDSQGAFYVRVDWDKSRALWGNFNTDITANEFAAYNRSLYGAQLVYRSTNLTEKGQRRNLVTGFVSEAQSASAHNEFEATGGSLYYLQKTDIVTGSEKLWIEIREEHASQVIERYPLRAGVDYDIDYFQGRIILTQPLSQIARRVAPSIIQDAPLQGDRVVLLVDYEYVPESLSFDNTVAGIRGKTWIADSVGLGATVIEEERDGEDYSLRGADFTWQPTNGSYVKGEIARSESNQAASRFVSQDGGLTFQPATLTSVDGREGDATGVEAHIDFADIFLDEKDGEFRLWHKKRDAGFSSSRDDRGIETTDKGVSLRWNLVDNLMLSLQSKEFEQSEVDIKASHRVQVDANVNEKLSLGVELQRSDHSFEDAEDQNAILLGGQVVYKINSNLHVFSKAQTVLDNTTAYEDNDQLSLGLSADVNTRFTLGGEVIYGDRGRGIVIGGKYALSEKTNLAVAAGFGSGIDSQVTANYLLDNGLSLYGSYARTNADNNEEKSTYTVGQRKRFGNGLAVYAENLLSDTDSQTGLTHVFGVDYELSDQLMILATLQRSVIEKVGEDISRHAATVGFRYKRSDFRASSRLEFRRDKSELDITQWLTTNAIEWKQSRDFRWLGNFNFSVSTNDDTDEDEAKFSETSVGFAYRPALHDRFNILARLTYISDLPAASQDTLQTEERSWVMATEAAYAVTPRWEVGGKLANKSGQVRQQRNNGPWFDTDVRFYAARLRYHLLKGWDGLAEYRWLNVRQDETVRSGALIGLYKHIGEHIKLGGGFNFTDFNDDLTDLDYDNRGWFIDIVAKY